MTTRWRPKQPDPRGPEPFSPGQRPRTHSLLGKGPVTPRVPEEGPLSPNSRGAPNLPRSPGSSCGVPDRPSGARTLIYYLDPSAGREPTPLLRLVWSRHVSTGTDTRTVARLHWKTCPPTAFNSGDISTLCHSRARGDFCQAALSIARYQGTQCSRWRRPRHACQSATPVGHDGSPSPIMMPTQ